MLRLESSSMYYPVVGDLGIRPRTQRVHMPQAKIAFDEVGKDLNDLKMTFADLDKWQNDLPEWELLITGWKQKGIETVVVVGIGGSDLGGRAIQNALQPPAPELNLRFCGDTLDPAHVDSLLQEVELPQSAFVIISKSGSTMETIAFYIYLRSLCEKLDKNWSQRFAFVTSTGSPLHLEGKTFGIKTFFIPDGVGGRFSVLSVVGALPALVMGVDIREMWQGAKNIFQKSSQSLESISFRIAWEQYALYTQGLGAVVLFNYAERLKEFSRWFRQLWAESLGKDGKGIWPLVAHGPADQHSQLQMFKSGTELASFLFLGIKDISSTYSIDNPNWPEFDYLHKQSFSDILQAERMATFQTLVNSHRPSSMLEVMELDAFTLGELFATFQLAVVYLARMMDVNAFDQPGVEESKQIIRHLLQQYGRI